jgi:predicted RNA-binding protein associated with RNAse of E/G family
VLILSCPGDAYSVQLFWTRGGWEFACWYIDLQEPLRRTHLGFDTRDHIVDAVVSPDRSSWRWKDEVEMAWSVEHGRLTPEQAAEIRDEGERAVAHLLADKDGFYSQWLTWVPDPSWPVPHIPPGWDILEGSTTAS